jgi:hypothetical protein
MVLLLEHFGIGWRGMWAGATVLIALMIPLVVTTVTRRTPAVTASTAKAAFHAAAAAQRHPGWLVAAYTCAAAATGAALA